MGKLSDKADAWREFRRQFNAMAEEQRNVNKSHWTDWGAWARTKAGKDFKARYVDLATRAGNELGPPESITPLAYWLEAVADDTGGVIWDLCRESASLCSHLLQEALRTSASRPGRDAKPTNKRKSFVLRILKMKGMSIHDWALKSDVDFHTANNYLNDRTNPHPSSRKKLAASLDIEPKKLPT